MPSDTLVVTFSPIRTGLSETGFGSGFVQWLGFTHVFVSEGADSLYQDLDPEALERRMAAKGAVAGDPDIRMELARIEDAVGNIPVPIRYSGQYYTLRSAIDLVRQRLGARAAV